MVSYDWANDGSVGVSFRHVMVSGLREELVLLWGMGMEFKDKIVLKGCREGYCEHGPVTGILCWVYDASGESHLTCLSGLLGGKADSSFGDL